MSPHADAALPPRARAWYRAPVVWLGSVLFVASIAGCIWIIVAGAGHPDVAVETPHGSILGVPAASLPDARTPAPPPQP